MSRRELPIERLQQVCELLVTRFGSVGWWPAEHPFEVMVGAVLVQNTRWANAERAITGLRDEGCLRPTALLALPEARLVALLRPAGCQSVKSVRLRGLATWVEAGGGIDTLKRQHTMQLRTGLLSLSGVGFETADAILCYAFDRAQFVADRYARRLLGRLGVFDPAVTNDYERCRTEMQGRLAWSAGRLQKLHAAIVRISQAVCRGRPDCSACVIAEHCKKIY